MEPQPIALTPWLHPPYHIIESLLRLLLFVYLFIWWIVVVMITDYVLIYVNGKPFNCSPNLSLEDLVSYLGFDMSSIILQYNGKVTPDLMWDKIIVMSGDKLELVTIVGGG